MGGGACTVLSPRLDHKLPVLAYAITGCIGVWFIKKTAFTLNSAPLLGSASRTSTIGLFLSIVARASIRQLPDLK